MTIEKFCRGVVKYNGNGNLNLIAGQLGVQEIGFCKEYRGVVAKKINAIICNNAIKDRCDSSGQICPHGAITPEPREERFLTNPALQATC